MIRDEESERLSPALLTDLDVVSSINKGNTCLYKVIIQRYNQTLYRVGQGFRIPDSSIEDLIQQTHMKAYRGLITFQGKSSFMTWITRIMINECLAYRKKKAFLKIPLTLSRVVNSIFLEGNSPEEIYQRKEIRNRIEQAINRLSVKHKSVFVLREVEEMSVQETAEILSLSEENVKVITYRAKKLLREHLMKDAHVTDIYPFGSNRCERLTASLAFLYSTPALIKI
jgi:RNA polymerase sigma-70 factor (ECF subfamily)